MPGIDPRRGLALGLIAGCALVVAGCGQDSESESRERAAAAKIDARETGLKVVWLGIDGGTFTVLDPLLEAGRLPNFARLIESGARGPLRSEKPMKSPALWTTIATGHDREEHGIGDFVVTVPGADGESSERVLVNSTMRRKLNVWDVLSAAGRSVGIAGWWSTWPAEPVRGWVVSDRLTRSRWSEWSDGHKDRAATFPPELAGELRHLVVNPAEPPLEEIRRLAAYTPAEEAELLAAEKPVRGHGPGVLKFAFSNQRTFEEIALELVGRGQPDLAAIFLIANDAISHTYWHLYDADAFEGVDRKLADRLGSVVPNMYRHNDGYLGRLLEILDDDTVVFVVSDHGFQASGKLPETARLAGSLGAKFNDDFLDDGGGVVTVGQPGVHHLEGIFIASGGPVVAADGVEASIYDLVPTTLALMGLPVPEDLPGRVLEEILAPDFLERFPVRTVPTYERLVNRRALRQSIDESTPDEERVEMLRSLGYLN